MIVKDPQFAMDSSGNKIPYELGKGFKLGIGTYYIDASVPDSPSMSVHCTWDSSVVATSLKFQGSNLPATKGHPVNTDVDSGTDIALNDATAGNWVDPNPNTTNVTSGTGITVTGTTVAIAGGTANGTIFSLYDYCRRGRIAITTTTGGYFRCNPHGK